MIGGRFRVHYVLGQGGMGVVVGAEHVELGQRVALKLLKDEHARDPEIVERLVREARAAATLDNDHIAYSTSAAFRSARRSSSWSGSRVATSVPFSRWDRS